MATKSKPSDTKVPVLKGQDAEDAVLDYMKRMNRPFGAVDVSANLKGAVPKTATQKILLSLAEKGFVVQKTYGKTTFFVANQANLEDVPPGKLASLESGFKALEEENKQSLAQIKSKQAVNLTYPQNSPSIKATPTDVELASQINEVTAAVRPPSIQHLDSPLQIPAPINRPFRNFKIQKLNARLDPLRSGAPLVSPEDLALLDTDWSKSRNEWLRRRKIFNNFWALVSDALPPQEAKSLAEDLGIEFDTAEHLNLERGPLCAPPSRNSVLGKRRR
ncbi:hypothetical protein NLI96_g637 [Meripilus lineatus]|uniref:Homologous-pairing protein 2 winged helix domain-containing protein n=1 Tax=Meripilus lineatus TaxID=2056292 RepID=A0AAD5YLT2_9APHY|nr:hypothetical protein NLI96_g637 [Physisporinus lineatus]